MTGEATSALADEVSRIRWFHTIDLPGGIVTDGAIDSSTTLARLDLPQSLHGRSVLDIGAWDGYYSFECARRGAERVLATDSYSWSGGGWGTQEGFLLARAALGLEEVVHDRHVDVMDLSPGLGSFDVVLLLGVLYHLTDPVRAIERAASCCEGLLVIETETALNWLPYPAARLYPGSELGNDHTNWYQYNASALVGLLRRVGFGEVEVKYRSPLHRRIARAVRGPRHGQSVRMMIRSSRIIVHARRTGQSLDAPPGGGSATQVRPGVSRMGFPSTSV